MDDTTFIKVLNNIEDLKTLKRLYKYAEEYEDILRKEYEELEKQYCTIGEKLKEFSYCVAAPRTVMVHDRISEVVLEGTDD